jgi:hypothetical protein
MRLYKQVAKRPPMPALYEGFGMPLIETQLCGAPVIHGSHASMIEAAAECQSRDFGSQPRSYV